MRYGAFDESLIRSREWRVKSDAVKGPVGLLLSSSVDFWSKRDSAPPLALDTFVVVRLAAFRFNQKVGRRRRYNAC